ncbi:MAG: hypothetical protein FWF43_09260 [Propionibacteriaceae bacterium]|nr:hypothetical protein [Propionibacteriaceae bacterium]
METIGRNAFAPFVTFIRVLRSQSSISALASCGVSVWFKKARWAMRRKPALNAFAVAFDGSINPAENN